MKKFNKNSLLFVLAFLFILYGLFSGSFLRAVGGTLLRVVRAQYSIEDAKSNLDSITSKGLNYHSQLIDINSIKENILGTRIVKKEDTTVVKSDAGILMELIKKTDKKDIKKNVKKIEDLKTVAENSGANFLYCAVPNKEVFQRAPTNADNYSRQNFSIFLSELASKDIPAINFSDVLIKNHSKYATYYNTDLHWTVRSGFDANIAILEELNTRYGLAYDRDISDITNYDIEQFPNWFLGSMGKKVGTYFTWKGADDFELITPKFQTDLTEELFFENQTRCGDFKQSVLHMDSLKKNYYNVNTYAVYSGGNYRLQIIRNNMNSNGIKVLLIRDSFACVVAPFLSLQFSELHECDMRDDDYFVGDKLNMEDYIDQIKPDYVLVLYNGVGSASDSRYDFF